MFFLVNRFEESIEGTPVRRVRSELQSDSFSQNGFHVVDVPDNIGIDETNTSVSGTSTFTYQDLLNEKYTSMLNLESYYDHVEYFDLLSGRIDMTASGTRGGSGNLTTFLAKKDSSAGNGKLQTSAVDVSGDNPGSFSEFAVHWTVFTLDKNETDNITSKTYIQEAKDSINVFISNDGGSTFKSVSHLDNTVFSSPGNQIIIRFENTDSSKRYYLGDFGFLY